MKIKLRVTDTHLLRGFQVVGVYTSWKVMEKEVLDYVCCCNDEVSLHVDEWDPTSGSWIPFSHATEAAEAMIRNIRAQYGRSVKKWQRQKSGSSQ